MEVRLGGADTDHEQQVCTPAHSYELISADKKYPTCCQISKYANMKSILPLFCLFLNSNVFIIKNYDHIVYLSNIFLFLLEVKNKTKTKPSP